MRRILPFGSFVLADVRCASQNWRPARSSVGLKPWRERVGVVARGQVEAAVGAEVERAAGVAALRALVAPGVDDLLLAERLADRVVGEARDAVGAVLRASGRAASRRPGRCGRRRRSRARAGCPAGRSRGSARPGSCRSSWWCLAAGRPHLHAAVELDVERAPVVGDVDLHRGVRVVVERDLLEVGGDRRHVRACSPQSPARRRPCAGRRAGGRGSRARRTTPAVWPIAVYQERPPSKSEHHATGWSSSMLLPSSSP